MEFDILKENLHVQILGKFMCIVSNEAGEDDFTYEIIVFSAPTFVDAVLNGTTFNVTSGAKFRINYQVNGFPTPDVSSHFR